MSLFDSYSYTLICCFFSCFYSGTRGETPHNRPPTAADLLKLELERHAAMQAAAAAGPTNITPTTPLNVTLTLKRAQSMEQGHHQQRQQGALYGSGAPSIRMPTVGSLLAGLGMSPHGSPIHTTGRTTSKKGKKKKTSANQAALAIARSAAAAGSVPRYGVPGLPFTTSGQMFMTSAQGVAVTGGLNTATYTGQSAMATSGQNIASSGQSIGASSRQSMTAVSSTSWGHAATHTLSAKTTMSPSFLTSKEGQQSKGHVVTIQALSGPQLAAPSPASLSSSSPTAAAARLASATLSQQQGLQQQMSAMFKTSSASTPHVRGTPQVRGTPKVRGTNPSRQPPAVRKPTQSKSQKISKLISSAQSAPGRVSAQSAPGRVPEVRYSIPTGRQNPTAAQHAAALQSARLTLQSLQSTAAGKSAAGPHHSTRPQMPNTGGVHLMGGLSQIEGSKQGMTTIPVTIGSMAKLEGSKQGMTTIPMSLLLQGGQAIASSSAGLPKGAMLSSHLLGNIPVGVSAQGKGLIFQMPPGSKLVTAMPVSTSAATATTVSSKAPVQSTTSSSASMAFISKPSVHTFTTTSTVTIPSSKASIQATSSAAAIISKSLAASVATAPSVSKASSQSKSATVTVTSAAAASGRSSAASFATIPSASTGSLPSKSATSKTSVQLSTATFTTSSTTSKSPATSVISIPISKTSLQSRTGTANTAVVTLPTARQRPLTSTAPMTTSATPQVPGAKPTVTSKVATRGSVSSPSVSEMGGTRKEKSKQDSKSVATTTASAKSTNA